MMYLLIAVLMFASFANLQSQPPIAENDTVTVLYNIKTPIKVRDNDEDPDGGGLKIDTVFYNGDAEVTYTITTVYYTGAIGFSGWDSLQYVLKDTDTPVGYDTAWVFINVRQAHFEMLDINNINAYMGKDANMFYDKVGSSPGFEVPAGSGNHTIFATVPWLGGMVNGVVKVNSLRFGQVIPDYPLAGPIMDEQWYTEYDEKWDRVWKVSRDEIIYHQFHWEDENYQPIEVIANWPAHGDPDKGQAVNIAPFVDINGDGVYNPMDGDYPEILGDQAVFLVYNLIRPYVLLSQNDESVDLEELLANVSNTEMHGLFYAFECEEDSALQYTVFANIKFINRADETYNDTYLGMWTDTDIGRATDDYIGSDVMRNTFYGYNGVDFDSGNPGEPGEGYGGKLPAQSTTILRGVKMDNDGLDNEFGVGENQSVNGLNFGDGIVDNEYWGMNYFMAHQNNGGAQGDPQTAAEYYTNLKGLWKDLTLVTYGGIGYNPDNPEAIPARFIYPGNSDPMNYGTGGVEVPEWSEVTEENIPFDRRGVGSTGPFTLFPFDTAEVDVAFVFGRDTTSGVGKLAPIPIMQERIDSIRSYFMAGQTPCGDFVTAVEEIENSTKPSFFSVYPNPFSDYVTIDNQSNQNLEIVVYNLLGKELLRQIAGVGTTRIDLSQIRDNALIIKAINGDNAEAKKLLRVR